MIILICIISVILITCFFTSGNIEPWTPENPIERKIKKLEERIKIIEENNKGWIMSPFRKGEGLVVISGGQR